MWSWNIFSSAHAEEATRPKKVRDEAKVGAEDEVQGTLPVVNDEGAPITYGSGADGRGRLYCGRFLPFDDLLGSSEHCGPQGGPQCSSCKRCQDTREGESSAVVGSAAYRTILPEPDARDGALSSARASAAHRTMIPEPETPQTVASPARARTAGGGDAPSGKSSSGRRLRSALRKTARAVKSEECPSIAGGGVPSPGASRCVSFIKQAPIIEEWQRLPLAMGAPDTAEQETQTSARCGTCEQASQTEDCCGCLQESLPPTTETGPKMAAQYNVCSGPLPLEPQSCSLRGGAHLRWIGAAPPPAQILIGSRPCATLYDGVFVAPMCRADASTLDITREDTAETRTVDVVLEDESGDCHAHRGTFVYWTPGTITAVMPAMGPLMGNVEVQVSTTDLAACITEVRLRGVSCTLLGRPTSTSATVLLPAAASEGDASVQVFASNGNRASLEQGGFSYYTPEFFGVVSDNVSLTDDGLVATRKEGIHRAVCFGGFPVRHLPEGRYFEIEVREVCKGSRVLALGICVRPPQHRLRIHEARDLDRVWLAGYDRGGALFIADGVESKIQTAAWRPARGLVVGTRIGALWREVAASGPELVIFQDGVERVRLPATGRLPGPNDELLAVVDVQGSVKSVRMIRGSSPQWIAQSADPASGASPE